MVRRCAMSVCVKTLDLFNRKKKRFLDLVIVIIEENELGAPISISGLGFYVPIFYAFKYGQNSR